MEINYTDAEYPVRGEFSESHTRFWHRLQNAGSWFTAAQRIEIARAVREARECSFCTERKQALSPHAIQGEHTGNAELPAIVTEVVHCIVCDASRLTKSW